MALEQLRAWRSGIDQETLGPIERIGDDGFPLLASSELRKEHEFVSKLVTMKQGVSPPELSCSERTNLLLALLERMFAFSAELSTPAGYRHIYSKFFDYGTAATIGRELFRAGTDEDITAAAVLEWFNCYRYNYYGTGLLRLALNAFARRAQTPLSDGDRALLIQVRGQAVDVDYSPSETFHAVQNNEATVDESIAGVIDRIVGPGLWTAIIPNEAWSVRALRDVEAMDAGERDAWVRLLNHCQTATSARPSAKWLKAGKAAVAEIGPERFREKLLHWFPLVEKGRSRPMLCMSWEAIDESQRMHTINAVILRGLLWLCPDAANPELTRAIGRLSSSAYKKIRGLGPRAVKVGNAAIYALSAIGNLDAVGQLAILQAKVKFGTAQKELAKAFTAAAEALKIPSDEIQEIGVPTYGLTDVGVCEEKFGNFTARLKVIDTTKTELSWANADGRIQKGVPAAVKDKYSEELKELKGSAKDIEAMLPAQRDRIDAMFLQQRTWPAAIWRERYLDHPLVGTLARRILWEFTRGGKTTVGIWFDGHVVDLDLKPIEIDGAIVRLWHPIGKSLDEVVAWRTWLETQQIQQPFKQAHREIYLLTDAELHTRTYSNRYAAHVLKQHQFNALCAARGWKNQLRLMVDAEYAPPSLLLPQWGLRAEFWVEGIGGDYGTDTTDSGAYLRLSTDQVRFYGIGAQQRTAHAGGGGYHPSRYREETEPLPLQEIPELVFSEVMRDVDLFVGVASVGNDPTWADGGPNGRYAAYWHDYSFGALNATAKTRKDVLQRLLPKIKIAPVCSFTDKFIVVKGKVRTYKIHLGSGNILMEPNDQYLCIVPRQSQDSDGSVMLPFEGDRTLSVILSKAFMLAADDKIRDETIVSQISRK